MTKVEDKYEVYTHISNSGLTFTSTMKDLDGAYGGEQLLNLKLHSFGMHQSYEIRLDANVIRALEYIVEKARLQRDHMDAVNPPKHIFTEPPTVEYVPLDFVDDDYTEESVQHD